MLQAALVIMAGGSALNADDAESTEMNRRGEKSFYYCENWMCSFLVIQLLELGQLRPDEHFHLVE